MDQDNVMVATVVGAAIAKYLHEGIGQNGDEFDRRVLTVREALVEAIEVVEAYVNDLAFASREDIELLPETREDTLHRLPLAIAFLIEKRLNS